MKISTFRLFRLLAACCLTLVLAETVRAGAAPTITRVADADLPPLDGLWKGPLKVPGGQLEVIFRLQKITDGYFCTLDVPLQKVSRMNVKAEVKGDTIRL